MAGDHPGGRRRHRCTRKAFTAEMIRTFLRGGAGINVLARRVGADVAVVDSPELFRIWIPNMFVGNEQLRIYKVGRGTANLARDWP